jgi:single-stranded DNA-binding protein
MIDCLVGGRLFGKPAERRSKNGNAFVTAKLRAATRDGEALFVNVIAFSESAIAALLALEDRDAVALAGELKASGYLDKSGKPQPSLDLLAHSVLTEFHVKRKRQAVNGAPREAAPERRPQGPPASAESSSRSVQREFDDEIPF